MDVKRLPYGATKNMSPEEYKEYKRELQRRWRKEHPEYMKENNRHWYRFYQRVKPRVCVCKFCGQEFNAPRSYYKICPECRNKPSKHKLLLMARAERKKTRQELQVKAIEMYKKGLFERQIAEKLNVSQKCISNWVRGTK